MNFSTPENSTDITDPHFYHLQTTDLNSTDIEHVYGNIGLPAFYVIVLYLPVEEKNYFVGGKKESKFVRISIQHIARHFPSNKVAAQFIDTYESILAPFIKERGLDWEISVEEVDRNLWRVNGLEGPLPGTVAEKEWIRLNKAVPYDEKDNVLG